MALTSSKACTRCSSWAKRALSLSCGTVMRLLLGSGHATGDAAECPRRTPRRDRHGLHPTGSPRTRQEAPPARDIFSSHRARPTPCLEEVECSNSALAPSVLGPLTYGVDDQRIRACRFVPPLL